MKKLSLNLQLLAKHSTTAGTTIHYSADLTPQATWTDDHRITSLVSTPDLGSAPAAIDSTTLDNVRTTTAEEGLIDLGQLEFEFYVENPKEAEANIRTIVMLTNSKDATGEKQRFQFKISDTNGVENFVIGTVTYVWTGQSVGAIRSIKMTITVNEELRTELPTLVVPRATVDKGGLE